MEESLRCIWIKRYAYALIAAALLGTQVLSVEVGGFKLSLYRGLLLLFPLFLAVTGVAPWRALRRNFNYGYLGVLVFWLAYSVVSLLWVKDNHAWFRAFFFLFCGTVGTSVIALSFKTRQDFIVAFKVMEVMFLIHSVLAMYTIFTGDYTWSPVDYSYSNQFNKFGLYYPSGLLGNLNTVCLYMFFGFLNSLLLFYEKKRKAGKALSLLAMVVFSFILIEGGSRGALIGLLFGLAVVGYCVITKTRRLRPALQRQVNRYLNIGLLAVLVLVLWKIEHILRLFITGTESDKVRIALIQNGVYFLNQSRGGGVGLGNIEYYMADGNPPYHTNGFTNIHNWWMEILVSSGIGVFLLYVSVYLRSLWLTYRHIHSRHHFAQVCVLGSMCGFIFASLSASTMMGLEAVWIIMGLFFFFVGNHTFYSESDVDIDNSEV